MARTKIYEDHRDLLISLYEQPRVMRTLKIGERVTIEKLLAEFPNMREAIITRGWYTKNGTFSSGADFTVWEQNDVGTWVRRTFTYTNR